MTYLTAAAPSRIRDLKPVLHALVAAADLFAAVQVGMEWLSSFTKEQLWRVADVLTAPGITDTQRWESIAAVRAERAASVRRAA